MTPASLNAGTTMSGRSGRAELGVGTALVYEYARNPTPENVIWLTS